MSEKTIIVTGANRGLGYEAVKALAADKRLTIILAGRNLSSTQEAAAQIGAETGHTQLPSMALDLGDLASVRSFAQAFIEGGYPPLTGIICNAGLSMASVDKRTADGYELTFGVNHLGHFLLVNLLLGQLQAPARIVFVSSSVHAYTEMRGPIVPARYEKAEWLAYPDRDPNLLADAEKAGGQAYANSKLCNVLCTYELVRRLEAAGLSTEANPITVNAFGPGLMAGTGLGRDSSGFTRLMWYRILPFMSRFMSAARTVQESGENLAWLATEPSLQGVTAKYFFGREEIKSGDASYDEAFAADLWETSVQLTDLTAAETALPLA